MIFYFLIETITLLLIFINILKLIKKNDLKKYIIFIVGGLIVSFISIYLFVYFNGYLPHITEELNKNGFLYPFHLISILVWVVLNSIILHKQKKNK